MSDAPDIAQELERKVSETLSETLRALSRGTITPESALASLRALWGAASGLIPHDLMDLIAESTDAITETKAPSRCRVLVKGDRTVVVRLPEQTNIAAEVIMTCKGGLNRRSILQEDDTLIEATRKAEKAADHLIKIGYEEIT